MIRRTALAPIIGAVLVLTGCGSSTSATPAPPATTSSPSSSSGCLKVNAADVSYLTNPKATKPNAAIVAAAQRVGAAGIYTAARMNDGGVGVWLILGGKPASLSNVRALNDEAQQVSTFPAATADADDMAAAISCLPSG